MIGLIKFTNFIPGFSLGLTESHVPCSDSHATPLFKGNLRSNVRCSVVLLTGVGKIGSLPYSDPWTLSSMRYPFARAELRAYLDRVLRYPCVPQSMQCVADRRSA